MRQRILTGIRPTGRLHLGHFFGVLQQTVALQDEFETFFMIADVQALTDHFHEPEKVREHVFEVALDAFACGVDPARSTTFIQSLIPEIAELTVFYSNLVTVGRLGQNPTVRAEIAQKRDLFGESVTYGFLGYPVSQAADITAFDASLVPVGEDQRPMLEQTREIVRRFNRFYGETLREPQARVVGHGRLRGLDGDAKMGKSLNNAVFLSDPAQTVNERIANAVTDSQKLRLHDAGRPEVCTVFEYHRLFSGEQLETIGYECRTGARGCVACKRELAGNVNAFLEPIRQRRAALDRKDVLRRLLEGTRRARAVAAETLARVKRAMNLSYEGAA